MRIRGERWLIAVRPLHGTGQPAAVSVHAALRLHVDLRGRLAFHCGICTPLGVLLRGGRQRWRPLPLAARSPAGALAALLVGGVPGTGVGHARVLRGGERFMSEYGAGREQTPGEEPFAQRLLTSMGRVSGASTIADALAAVSRPEAAVGAAVSAGGYTAVPLVETMFAGGYGMGLGGGNAPGSSEATDGQSMGGGGGGGGGGAGRSRVVAVLVVGPEGVELRPVVDVTRLGLAGIAAALGLVGILRRWWR